jgi:hypothetical protein
MEFTPAQLLQPGTGDWLGQRNHNGVHPSAQLAFTAEKDDWSRTEGHCCCRRAPTGFGSYYDTGKPARSVPPNSWRLWIRRLQLLSCPALPCPASRLLRCACFHARSRRNNRLHGYGRMGLFCSKPNICHRSAPKKNWPAVPWYLLGSKIQFVLELSYIH